MVAGITALATGCTWGRHGDHMCGRWTRGGHPDHRSSLVTVLIDTAISDYIRIVTDISYIVCLVFRIICNYQETILCRMRRLKRVEFQGTMKFRRRLGSTVAETPAKFHNDTCISTPELVPSGVCGVLRWGDSCDIELSLRVQLSQIETCPCIHAPGITANSVWHLGVKLSA